MHRKFLLDKLEAHTAHDDEEQEMLQRIIQFVNDYEDCFKRELSVGHITGSAWIINRERTHVLLTHHKKLDRWLQLGGHSDGDANTLNVALKEGREESGLDVKPLSEDIFDVDVHLIPARKQDPEHYHYDVRFLLEADSNQPFVVSEESHDLAWVALEDLPNLVDERSMLRMLEKINVN